MDVRVVIIYSDELERITVDGIEMENLSSIRHKLIKQWFEASNGRDGWEGLIKEIQKMIDDVDANLNFEFQGPKESKYIFEKVIGDLGFGVNADGLSASEIEKLNFDEAQKAEHRGLFKKALSFYIKAAEFGESAEASFMVGEYYYNYCQGKENGIDCDDEEAISTAIDYYEKAAKQGHIRAEYQLFKIFSEGIYVEEDRKMAIECLEKVAESGDVDAMIDLGDYLYNEYAFDEDDKDCKRALEWYRKAAKTNNDVAFMRIARCYRWGNGVAENEREAFKWYSKAAEQGNIRGVFQVAECYYHGRGVDKNNKKAVENYLKAANEDQADACYQLGVCYNYGYGVKEDQCEAFKWYLKAAEDDYIDAQAEVGFRYDVGKGVEHDVNKAVEWYLKAAENGNNWAQCNLGYLYDYGEVGSVDYQEAAKWYKMAAEDDFGRAQYNLAVLYENGDLGEVDEKSAFEWYKRAAENGYVLGMRALGRCYDFGKGTEKDYTKAIEWYRAAIDKNDIRSMYLLGQCYEYGTGVTKDIEEAFQWYKKAADADSPDSDACYKIAEAYYAQMDPKILGRTGAMLAVSILVPVTNFVTIPAAIIGSALSSSNKNKKFLKTDAGKDMMKYYRRAAELGHEDAKKKVKQLEVDEK